MSGEAIAPSAARSRASNQCFDLVQTFLRDRLPVVTVLGRVRAHVAVRCPEGCPEGPLSGEST